MAPAPDNSAEISARFRRGEPDPGGLPMPKAVLLLLALVCLVPWVVGLWLDPETGMGLAIGFFLLWLILLLEVFLVVPTHWFPRRWVTLVMLANAAFAIWWFR